MAGWMSARKRAISAAALLFVALPPVSAAHAQITAFSAPPYRAAAAGSLDVYVSEAAHRFGIPAPWIRAVIQAESGGDASAVSPKGAMGFMQIMPDTYAGLRATYGLGADPFEPRDNILAGAAYLREMYDRYGAAGFLAAYNCGPACYDDHLATGHSLPSETRAYVAALMPVVAGDVPPGGSITAFADADAWKHAPLFAVQAGSSVTAASPLPDGSLSAPSSVGIAALELSSNRHLDDRPNGAALFIPVASAMAD